MNALKSGIWADAELLPWENPAELAELRDVHLRARVAREVRREPQQLSIPGLAPERGGEGEEPEHRQFEVIEKRINTPSTNSAVTWPAVVG